MTLAFFFTSFIYDDISEDMAILAMERMQEKKHATSQQQKNAAQRAASSVLPQLFCHCKSPKQCVSSNAILSMNCRVLTKKTGRLPSSAMHINTSGHDGICSNYTSSNHE